MSIKKNHPIFCCLVEIMCSTNSRMYVTSVVISELMCLFKSWKKWLKKVTLNKQNLSLPMNIMTYKIRIKVCLCNKFFNSHSFWKLGLHNCQPVDCTQTSRHSSIIARYWGIRQIIISLTSSKPVVITIQYTLFPPCTVDIRSSISSIKCPKWSHR